MSFVTYLAEPFSFFSFRLKIRRAMPSDTGNYTCVPTIAKSSSVYVHVIIGKYIAK